MIGNLNEFAEDELIIDNFAGGGGASTGIEQALGRPVDIAINHDREALALHAANHPNTQHLCEDVWAVDIKAVIGKRRVGLAWFSPDCKHFSKAKGGKPVEKKIRGLAWVALRWAGLVKPRVIVVENVEEFQGWGPIVDGIPCKRRKGMTFKRWVTQLRNLGYEVDWRELRACDYGAPTIRKRLFVIARCDGQPIPWPEKTHGKGLIPYRTAAECIDWSIPCPSIFLSKKEARKLKIIRPLADKTLARIAKGVKRYVLGNPKPFIVTLTHAGAERIHGIDEPFKTVTGAHRGEHALVVPFIGTYYGANRPGGDRTASTEEPLRTQSTENRFAIVSAFLSRQFGKSIGSASDSPIGVVTPGGGGKTAIVAAHLAKHFGGMVGVEVDKPLPTTTTRGTQTQIVTSHIMKMRGTNIASSTGEPLHTISAGGCHHAEVRSLLEKYLGEPGSAQLTIDGELWGIVDIGMRMLTPRELFLAQGFPPEYIIDGGRDVTSQQGWLVGGEWIELTKTAQIRMCGNSVSPYPACAIITAQFQRPMVEAAA